MSLSAFVVDAVVIGDVASLQNYRCDWAMRLLSAREVGIKIRGSLFLHAIFAFCVLMLSRQLRKMFFTR